MQDLRGVDVVDLSRGPNSMVLYLGLFDNGHRDRLPWAHRVCPSRVQGLVGPDRSPEWGGPRAYPARAEALSGAGRTEP